MIIISRSLYPNRTPWASCICCLQENNPNEGNRLWYDAFKSRNRTYSDYEVGQEFPVLLRLGRQILYAAQCKIVYKLESVTGAGLLNFLDNCGHYEPVLGDPYRNTIQLDGQYYFLGYEFHSSKPVNIEIPKNLKLSRFNWFRTCSDYQWTEFVNSLNL